MDEVVTERQTAGGMREIMMANYLRSWRRQINK